MMIWRIFKKDLNLLWPLAAIVAFAHALSALLWLLHDHVARLDDLVMTLAQLFPLIALFGSAILTVSAIHTDPLPGDREDWFVRPIRRFDLLAAKFLFVLLVAVGPVWVIGTSEALSNGLPFAGSAGAALGQGVALLVEICLPAMIFGAITRNATEAIMGAVVAGVSGVAVLLFVNLAGLHPTLNNSGLLWWGGTAFSCIIVAAALIILPLQYSRRVTAVSRLLIIPFFLPAMLFQELPWNTAFSAQQWLAPGSAAGDNVAISFDPGLSRSPRTLISAGVTGQHASLVNLPIGGRGISAGAVLLADNAEIRLIADGKIIYRQDSADFSYSVPAFMRGKTTLRQEGTSNTLLHGYQAILLPVAVLNRVRNRVITLEIDYSLSLFQKDAALSIAALDANQQLGKLGRCETQIDDDGDEVALRCVMPGQGPNCISATLVDPKTGQRDPETFVCEPDYRPMPVRLIPDSLARLGLGLKFQDYGNGAKYPVGEAQLGRARIDLATYRPSAHFTRHVVIHDIRLSDWEAPTAPAQ